jgi:hypothetical protein
VLAALLTAAVLASSPGDAPQRPKLTVRLSAGAFITSALVAPSYRATVDHLEGQAVGDLQTHGSLFDSQYLWQSAPVIGPWLVLAQGGYQAQQDIGLLIVSGLLQAIGLSTLTYRLITDTPAPVGKPKEPEGLALEIAPTVNNRLGIALTLTGW